MGLDSFVRVVNHLLVLAGELAGVCDSCYGLESAQQSLQGYPVPTRAGCLMGLASINSLSRAL